MKERIKKRLFLLALASAVSTAGQAQIAVVDVAQIANNIENQIETMAHWTTQEGQMATLIGWIKQQHNALTGVRKLGAILNDPALKDYLPADWQAGYDSVRSNGYAGLSESGRAIYEVNRIFDGCAFLPPGDQHIACEAQAAKGAQDKSFAIDAYKAARARLEQVEGLMHQIDATKDPKAIAELQGRIAVEQASIQNEQTKLQLYAMVAQAENRLLQQRAHELNMRDAAKRGTLGGQPMDFKLGR